MNDLVYLKKNDAFTDSMVIAEGTGNQHESVVAILKKYHEDFEESGRLEFTDFKSGKRGRPSKVYYLNEEQATLLITYLDNTETVRDFKKNLVHQFFEMRKFIAEKATTTWIETRQQGKLTRRAETDTLQRLVEYAKEQGSTHSDKLYITYTKLANKMAGVERRDMASIMQLNNLSMMETIILHMVDSGILMGKHYKDIYKDCKARLETVTELAYLRGAT